MPSKSNEESKKMVQISSSNQLIAKNTLMLYCRTLLIMAVALYTSRIVLDVLGIDNYGIYNVVGGIIGMFSAISGALSLVISRYMTFELGRGDAEKLNRIFSISINILLLFSFIIILIGETVGVWFLNWKMHIAPERLYAANWVLQTSLLAFCINLVSIPYNAVIVAHERMSAFAFISIIEAILKFLICYLLLVIPTDKLIAYSVFITLTALVIYFIYMIYCRRSFDECRYCFVYDRLLMKDMVSFTIWSFITHMAYVLNTQGVNILMNLFFGVALNAARGVAVQVQNAIMQFVTNFTMALNPQITKFYVQDRKKEMFNLICRGAKFSFFLLLVFSLPIMFEVEYILKLWLKIVPEHTANFIRLTIIGGMIDRLGDTGSTACRATGKIRGYSITLTTFTCLVFPFTWMAFGVGMPVESTYLIFIFVYVIVGLVRLFLMKRLLDFPPGLFLRKVICRISATSLLSLICPLLIVTFIPSCLYRFLLSIVIGIVATIVIIYSVGLSVHERIVVMEFVKNRLQKKRL